MFDIDAKTYHRDDEEDESAHLERLEAERKKASVAAKGKPVSVQSFKKVRFTTYPPKTTTLSTEEMAGIEAREVEVR